MDATRNRMSESMSLIEYVHDYKVVKKVYGRVVYLKRKDLPEKLAETEEEPSEEKTRRCLQKRPKVACRQGEKQGGARWTRKFLRQRLRSLTNVLVSALLNYVSTRSLKTI